MQQTDIGQHIVDMQSLQCLRSGAHLDPSGAALGLLFLPGRRWTGGAFERVPIQ